jgi:hypothetical protein
MLEIMFLVSLESSSEEGCMGLVPFGMLEIVFLVSLESHQHTMKDGWKVIRKEFSVGFHFPS